MSIVGLPGIKTSRTYTPRDVLLTDIGAEYLAGSRKVIDASNSRDPDNTGNVDVLRPGLFMSKIESTGLYAPTIIDYIETAYGAGVTSFTLSAAAATELNRRYGGTGAEEFYVAGMSTNVFSDETALPSMEGITHTAIDTTTGVVTCSALQNEYPYGFLVIAGEAVRTPSLGQLTNTVILNDTIKVTDVDGNNVDVAFPRFLIAGQINTARLINYPNLAPNATLANWLKIEVNDGNDYKFSDDS